jgi:hypothetical protein
MIDKINKPTEYNAFQFSTEFTRKFVESKWNGKLENICRMKVGKHYKCCFTVIDNGTSYEVNITKRTIKEVEQSTLNFLGI